MLAQFGIGGPSQAQQAEEADKIAVSKVWTRPKGTAVANGKGGSGKTPTSLYLAAMFARLGGGMVLVDDNNTMPRCRRLADGERRARCHEGRPHRRATHL